MKSGALVAMLLFCLSSIVLFLHDFNVFLKAYCGFKGHGDDEPDIATGKWGCGAFNGDPQLKGKLFQCCLASHPLIFD